MYVVKPRPNGEMSATLVAQIMYPEKGNVTLS